MGGDGNGDTDDSDGDRMHNDEDITGSVPWVGNDL